MQAALDELNQASEIDIQGILGTLAMPRNNLKLCLERAAACYEYSPFYFGSLVLIAILHNGGLCTFLSPADRAIVELVSKRSWAVETWMSFVEHNPEGAV